MHITQQTGFIVRPLRTSCTAISQGAWPCGVCGNQRDVGKAPRMRNMSKRKGQQSRKLFPVAQFSPSERTSEGRIDKVLQYDPDDFCRLRCRRRCRLAQFTQARPECVNGVVFMGGGYRTGGKLAKMDLPALLIRGSRDPFTPEEVRTACVGRFRKKFSW